MKGWGGVGLEGWGVSCRGGVGHVVWVGNGGVCHAGVGHLGVRWVM